jgi:hypothetical protein
MRTHRLAAVNGESVRLLKKGLRMGEGTSRTHSKLTVHARQFDDMLKEKAGSRLSA